MTPVVAVAVQHGEPEKKIIGIGGKKLRMITKRLTESLGPAAANVGRSRLEMARARFRLIEAGKITGTAAAALERDYAREFARFRRGQRHGQSGEHQPTGPGTTGIKE